MGASNATGMKNCDFPLLFGNISEMIQYRAIVAIEGE